MHRLLEKACKDKGGDIAFEDLQAAAEGVLRVRGHRVQWARSIGLEGALAQFLKVRA